ncbi:MAG: hypothetical protein HYS09_07695 [Chloroflexi bacterium]|nr:hypothetical protein [Chloroflexota bacterium]
MAPPPRLLDPGRQVCRRQGVLEGLPRPAQPEGEPHAVPAPFESRLRGRQYLFVRDRLQVEGDGAPTRLRREGSGRRHRGGGRGKRRQDDGGVPSQGRDQRLRHVPQPRVVNAA